MTLRLRPAVLLGFALAARCAGVAMAGVAGTTAAAAVVKSIDLNTNHAKSPLAGVQWVVEPPKDFRVEKMAGDVAPGGRLTGRIVGSRAKTSWNLDFEVTLPAKDAAAGMSCGK